MKVKLISWDEFEYDIVQSQKIEKHFVKITLPFLWEDFTWIELKDWETIEQKLSEYLRSRSQHIDAICKKYETVETEETQEEKTLDRDLLQKAFEEWFTYFVNITTEDWKKYAVLHDVEEAIKVWMEYDKERWDRIFDNKKEAEEYIKSFQ